MSAHVVAAAASGPIAPRRAVLPPDREECWEQILQTWDVPTRFDWTDYRAVSYEDLAGDMVRTLAQAGPVSRLVLATVAPDITMTAQPALALLRIADHTVTGDMPNDEPDRGSASKDGTVAAHRIAPTLAITDQGPLTTLTALRIAARAAAPGSSTLLVAADRANLPYTFGPGAPDLTAPDPAACAVAVRLEHSGDQPGVTVAQGRQQDVADLCAQTMSKAGVFRFDRVVVAGLPESDVTALGIECDAVVEADAAQQATGLLAEAQKPGRHLLIAVDSERQRAAVAVLPVVSL